MSEEYNPNQSRYIDLLSGSTGRYVRGVEETSARMAPYIHQGGMARGQAIGQGFNDIGGNLVRGLQQGRENKLSEEQIAEQKRANAEREAQTQAGLDESTAARIARDKQNMETLAFQKQQAGFTQERQTEADQLAATQREAAKKKAAGLASLRKALAAGEMTPAQIQQQGAGPVDLVNYGQNEMQMVTDELAARGYSPDEINQLQLEAFGQHSQENYMRGLARQQSAEFKQAAPVAQRGNIDLNAMAKLKDIQKTYEDLGAWHGQEEEEIGEKSMDDYKDFMTKLGFQKVADGIDYAYAKGMSKREYMKRTIAKVTEDRKNSLAAQISALPAKARQQPEIQALEEQLANMGRPNRPTFNGRQPVIAQPKPVNPFPTAGTRQDQGIFKQAAARSHPFE